MYLDSALSGGQLAIMAVVVTAALAAWLIAVFLAARQPRRTSAAVNTGRREEQTAATVTQLPSDDRPSGKAAALSGITPRERAADRPVTLLTATPGLNVSQAAVLAGLLRGSRNPDDTGGLPGLGARPARPRPDRRVTSGGRRTEARPHVRIQPVGGHRRGQPLVRRRLTGEVGASPPRTRPPQQPCPAPAWSRRSGWSASPPAAGSDAAGRAVGEPSAARSVSSVSARLGPSGDASSGASSCLSEQCVRRPVPLSALSRPGACTSRP
jgi:hypothetical protein